MSVPEDPTVTLLRLRAPAQAFDVHWDDGTTAELPYRLLRERCPCAECRQRRHATGAFQAGADIKLLAAIPIGPNAIQLRFSDGHARGIFPFSYLRELHGETRATPGISK